MTEPLAPLIPKYHYISKSESQLTDKIDSDCCPYLGRIYHQTRCAVCHETEKLGVRNACIERYTCNFNFISDKLVLNLRASMKRNRRTTVTGSNCLNAITNWKFNRNSRLRKQSFALASTFLGGATP